jgi:hypothetical protein
VYYQFHGILQWMYFHKFVNATGRVQNAEFIRGCIREVVVEEIGEQFVV